MNRGMAGVMSGLSPRVDGIETHTVLQFRSNMLDLIYQVKEWADAKGILNNGAVERQALKMVEEVGEFSGEIIKDDKQKQMCECGDVLVTLILVSHKLGFNLDEALQVAYNKISKRTGTTVNGVFIKDA